MDKGDWFRKNTWADKDREDFFARFSRSRKHNRAQYLRVQASHLEEAGSPEAIAGALELLDLLINGWPSPIELEIAHFQRARCYEILGRFEETITAYRQSFNARRNMLTVRTDAPFGFGMFAVRHDRTDLYEEIISTFHEFVGENDIVFPIQQYQYYTVLAIIADYHSHKESAREYAVRALHASTQAHSGFSRHPSIGLITQPEQQIDKRLEQIVEKK